MLDPRTFLRTFALLFFYCNSNSGAESIFYLNFRKFPARGHKNIIKMRWRQLITLLLKFLFLAWKTVKKGFKKKKKLCDFLENSSRYLLPTYLWTYTYGFLCLNTDVDCWVWLDNYWGSNDQGVQSIRHWVMDLNYQNIYLQHRFFEQTLI